MELDKLHDKILQCTRCPLYKSAEMAVPGEGPDDARIMLVGQNTGAKEDETGRPFVGQSGKYLDEVLNRTFTEKISL